MSKIATTFREQKHLCHCVINSFLCRSVPDVYNVCSCTHIKTSCWLAAHLFIQPINGIHQLRQDKRVFILAIAAVLSALPLRILVVFSDKAGQSAVGLRGLQCRRAGSEKKDWWWSKWRDREMLTMRLALCAFAELLLMLFGEFSRIRPVLWSLNKAVINYSRSG